MTIIAQPVEPSETVLSYLQAYWPSLEEQLDEIDDSMLDNITTNATTMLTNFDTSFLTDDQVAQATALFICVECGGMPGLGGYAQERHLTTLKIFDRTWKKDTTNFDHFIGELCRLLKITPKDLAGRSALDRAALYKVYTKKSQLASSGLDRRRQLWKGDYDLSDKELDWNQGWQT